MRIRWALSSFLFGAHEPSPSFAETTSRVAQPEARVQEMRSTQIVAAFQQVTIALAQLVGHWRSVNRPAPSGATPSGRRPRRSVGGLYDRSERPTCWKQERDHYLRKVTAVVAGGVNHSARIDPRLASREHLGVAMALERHLAGRHDHQLLSAMYVPWCPDAWVQVEQQVHQLESARRPLDLN